MKTENVERYLESFGKQVVNRAKSNLGRQKGGKTSLANTIKFDVKKTSDGFVVEFYMADYGAFLDKGVSGNRKSQSYKNYENKTISSPYKYTTKQPPPGILAKWIQKKGLKGRDKKTGRFISNLSLAFIIGRKIKRDGIKSLSFFQKPLGLGLKQFEGDLLNSIKEDIVDSMKKYTKTTAKI